MEKGNEQLNLKYILASLISLYSDSKEIKFKKYCSNLPNGITISSEHKLYIFFSFFTFSNFEKCIKMLRSIFFQILY